MKAYPEHVRIFQMGLGVPLLGVNEMRELGGVSDEEDWGVVEHPVPVTVVGLQLDRKSTRVASSISRSNLTSYGGEADGYVNFCTVRPQKGLGSDIAQVISNRKFTVGPSTFGVHLEMNSYAPG